MNYDGGFYFVGKDFCDLLYFCFMRGDKGLNFFGSLCVNKNFCLNLLCYCFELSCEVCDGFKDCDFDLIFGFDFVGYGCICCYVNIKVKIGECWIVL